MKYKIEKDPDPSQCEEIFSEAVRRGRMIVVVGRCSVDYEGRTQSYLPDGDRMIVRKPDGNFLVHTDENRKPVNWQPEGSSCKSFVDDGFVLLSESSSPDEVIEVRFDTVYTLSVYSISDDRSVEKYGTEKNIQDYLVENPEYIQDGFRVIEDERDTDVGAIDIFGYDADGYPTIVEIKRRRAGPDAVQQLRRYVENFEEKHEDTERPNGILMAPSLTEGAEGQVGRYGFEFREVPEKMYSTDQSTKLTDFT